MTWKTYAAMSGATILATSFAALSPSVLPGGVPPTQPRDASVAASSASDIEEQASRLHARLQQETLYREPSRNLFRFADRQAARPAAAPARVEAVAAEVLAPAPPPVTLTGIALDRDMQIAIFSTPGGVVLAGVGEEVAGLRVTAVSEDGVDLQRVDDGSTLRLPLSPRP